MRYSAVALQALVLLAVSMTLGLLSNDKGAQLPIGQPYVPTITVKIVPEAAYQLLNYKPAVFVDFRGAHSKGSIPRSIHVSLPPAPEVLENLQKSPDVISYGEDGSDQDAAESAARLQRLGVSRVLLLSGGWRGWQAKGYPAEP